MKKEWKTVVVTLLRAAVGWHFFWEGFAKVLDPSWSAKHYLTGSVGFLSGVYQWMGNSDWMMSIIDPINIAALLIIGFCLFTGLFTRLSAIFGAVLLAMYYFAYPPFGSAIAMHTDGHVYIVNKQFIEAAILVVLVGLKDTGFGFDNLKLRQKDDGGDMGEISSRRKAIKNIASLPLLGLMSAGAYANQKKYGADSVSGATIKVGALDINELKGELPKGKIGNAAISRLVLGGNLIGGWAHSRDLIYVPSLFKAYNTEKKIFETLALAEQAGINAINIGFPSGPLMQKYKRLTGSKIQVITQVAPDRETGDYFTNIDKAIDFGSDILQIQGNHCDWMVRDNKIDKIQLMLDYIRKQGYTAGLGAHSVEALIVCEKAGIEPDYYMKTMHHDRYWSAHPKENRVQFEVDGERHLDHNRFHDNIFCLDAKRSVEFVNRAKVPVMGFKVLAAGAIEPEDGFHWAFENGADFICVGMFDFQIVKDVNITIDSLQNMQNRARAWYG